MALQPIEVEVVSDDVCMIVEGTYPYVPGGVSAWVHDIVGGHPELRFSVFNIGSHAGAYGTPRYQLPAHVSRLHQVYCQEVQAAPLAGAERAALDLEIRALRRRAERRTHPSRVLSAIRRMHLEDETDDDLLADLLSGDLSLGEFLHG